MSEWMVRKAAKLLKPGERFIFAEELGGEGEVLTVVSATDVGITIIETEEYDDCTIEVMSSHWVTMAPDDEKEEE